MRMLGRSLGRSVLEGWRGMGGRDVVVDEFESEEVEFAGALDVEGSLIDREANAFSRSSPPPEEAQNFMYRSTILV